MEKIPFFFLFSIWAEKRTLFLTQWGLNWYKKVLWQWVYATGRQKEEDGKAVVCDKYDRTITGMFCPDLH